VGLKSTRKAGVAERKPDVITARKLGMVAKKPGAASINTCKTRYGCKKTRRGVH